MTQQIQHNITMAQDEYVTIIAPSLGAVMGQFRERGLGAKGFSITGPAVRHQFAYAGETITNEARQEDLFGGGAMIAATFRRNRTAMGA